jgi:S-adenosylmethionine:tRNA ribosyltransferase-isomerase
MVAELPELLSTRALNADGLKPLLVFNDSRVRKARLLGTAAETGAGVEFLLLKRLAGAEHEWQAMVQRAKRRRPGSRYVFAENTPGEREAEITACDGDYRIIRFDTPIDDDWLDVYGHIPLPPYIKRGDVPADSDRYQTVYAGVSGSAAAPTAGLHFTVDMLARLEAGGIETAFVTLHVGLGTFLPVRTEHIEDHVMHEEVYSITDETAAKIEKAKALGRRIIAVGTTSVRTLESAFTTGTGETFLRRGEDATSIFMYPGYQFKVADGLFTNFHTPESTLLMLVSAFAGRDLILESYREAVEKSYRFFSYGDAMLIL